MSKICNDRKGGDKILHALVCFIIAVVVGTIAAHLLRAYSPWLTFGIALVAALAVGIWKELRDSKQKGNHFCVWDLIADLIGATAGAAVGWLAAHFINVFI